MTGIDGTILNDGDTVLLYYGDPYGIGMQYPLVDTSNLQNGLIRFTSIDSSYDENYSATVTENPVIGASVTWYYNDSSETYITDDKGEIKIKEEQLTQGNHQIQISKSNNTGIPLVLRLPPDYCISIEEGVDLLGINVKGKDISTSSNADRENIYRIEIEKEIPKTGENSCIAVIVLMVISLGALLGSFYYKKKRNYEKQYTI